MRAAAATAWVLVAIGATMVVSTLARGGSALSTGILLGLLFVAAGAGRLRSGRGYR